MRKAKVTLIWEPVAECYIDTFKVALLVIIRRLKSV